VASWDTPVVNAPTTANYAAPVQDFSGIANLLQDFTKGRQMGREEDKARAFRNGIPRDSTGEPDFNKISDTAAKVGGIDYALPLLNLQVQRDAGAGNAAAVANAQGVAMGQPAQPAAPVQPAARPAAQPRQAPAVAPDNSGQDTIRSMATEAAGGNDAMPTIGSAARTLRINPDAPLTPEQSAKVKEFIAGAGAVRPVQQPAAPEPVATPAQRVAQGADAAPVSSGDMAKADRLDLAAAGLRQRAAATAGTGPMGKASADVLLKQADNFSEQAKQIREQVGTSNQPAPSIKEWRQSGSKLPYDEWVASAEGAKETAKEDAKANSKKYEQFVENGTKAQQEIPQLELLQQQMDDPNFFSGSGEKYNLLYKRLKSAVGIDPDAPVPQELLRKVTASNVLGSLSALKGLGPIRVAEMNMAREAAASPDNSIPANKMLVEISKRTHQRNAEIADMAQNYKEQNGALDSGFDKKVSQFYKDRPLFSDVEIKDWHKIIGQEKAATAPDNKTTTAKLQTFNSPADVAAAKLKSGTRFLDKNGVERMVP
jgi:hypothetical protein